MTRFEFQIEESSRKKRIDEFLFDVFFSLSKTYLRDVLKRELCQINGYAANAGVVLRQNDFVEIEVDADRETAMKPQAIPLEIVFEDAEILIVNKPAGMLVHPTHRDKNGTLLNALSHYLNFSQREQEYAGNALNQKAGGKDQKTEIVRPGLIHRLDRQTSGLMVIAKTLRAHRLLARQFARKLVEKKYMALVGGIVGQETGVITAPIGRFAEQKHWNVKADGKNAETRYRVLERGKDMTLLELEPVTGRTNQLRIHCAHIGHPIVGDGWHNGREFSRLCLHAYKIGFWNSGGNAWLEFTSEPPEEMSSP